MKDELEGVYITEGKVIPDWIDVNGHMNVAYYVKAFDLGVDEQWIQLGMTHEYIVSEQYSTFSVESHVTYQREIKVNEEYIIGSSILAYDEKRIHLFQTMYKKEINEIVATAEWMILGIDLRTRRVSPWPDKVLQSLKEMVSRQNNISWPDEAGKKMGIKEPLYSISLN